MAVYEKNGLMSYVDGAGNRFLLYPVTKADCVDGLEELLAEKAGVQVFTATIPTTGWTESDGAYTLDVAVSGLPECTPLIDIVQTKDETVDAPMREAWGAIHWIDAQAGNLQVCAGSIPAVEIPIQALVIS